MGLLKNFAIGAGAGIAVGLCATVNARKATPAARLDSLTDRLDRIEATLSDHSASIATLGGRAQDTEAHLQRLILAIEKLVERQAQTAEAADGEKRPRLARAV
jgi:chromosome segregation ATPase